MQTAGTHRDVLTAIHTRRPLPDTVAGMSAGETRPPRHAPPADTDSGYLHLLKAVVNAMDAAMAAEGVDADVRDRVVARVMGTPTPD